MSHSRIESFKEKGYASTVDRDELTIKFASARLGALLMLVSASVSITLIYWLINSLT